MYLRLLLTTLTIVLSLQAQASGDVREAMRRATQYMMERVAYRGGFVWNCLPDLSRRWGELEASPTMIWLQSPSTPEMGHLMLDAYHATGDEYYYTCARRIAQCIMDGQLDCGGWNYMVDFGTESDTREWYATIGRQAWRLEEFQHYYGNATFDDEATSHSTELLLRLYLEKKNDDAVLHSLQKAIRFFLASQYESGGWPQRFPLMNNHAFKGKADYTPFITLNDNVTPENIRLLTTCYGLLGMKDLQEPILRAMHLLRDLQQPLPLAGWADQYTPDDLRPAHARSYEPRSINTGTTVSMFHQMIAFYKLTGDTSYLSRLPEALQFLCSQQLPRELAHEVRRTPLQEDEILVPRFIDPDTQRPLYVHRKGGNVKTGSYYTDENPHGTIAHYSSFMVFSPSHLQASLEEAHRLNVKDLQRNNPFVNPPTEYPRYYWLPPRWNGREPQLPTAEEVMGALNEEGYWLSELRQVSHPYKALPEHVDPDRETREYAQTMVGDDYDTSPYTEPGVYGISTQTFIRNMSILISSLVPVANTQSGLQPHRFESRVTGKPTALYILRNTRGMEACITNYGARLVSLTAPDRYGHYEDVVLGFDNIADYHQQKQNFGATVGRYIGRIKGAQFTLDGETHHLQQTGGGNISHGGYPGFADQVWSVVSQTDSTLTLTYVSADGENGFPGELTVKLTYHLSYDNSLILDYEATSTKPTVVNLSNHSFFNISGQPSQSIASQLLWIDSKQIATYDTKKNLDGKLRKLTKKDAFWFMKAKPIGEDIDREDSQLQVTGGYDHSFLLSKKALRGGAAAVVYDPKSGRQLSVYTTEPVIHIYTANGLKGTVTGKQGIAYPRRSAICLETMHLSDSPNHPEWPSTVVRPGEVWHSATRFAFTVR